MASHRGFVDRGGGLSQIDFCNNLLVEALICVIIVLSIFNVIILLGVKPPFEIKGVDHGKEHLGCF